MQVSNKSKQQYQLKKLRLEEKLNSARAKLVIAIGAVLLMMEVIFLRAVRI